MRRNKHSHAIAAFFLLIRYRNLLIIALTQFFVWKCVITPLSDYLGYTIFLNNTHFILLSTSTILIAAAGYIINDYFDLRIDTVNKPDNVIIDRTIKRRSAILLHIILNTIGLGISVLLSLKLGYPLLWLLHFGCILLLWFYSTRFKRRFLSGNLVVAFLTGFTIAILAVYEPVLWIFFNENYFIALNNQIVVNPMWVIAVYTYFAFMLTWIREIIKDMEDFKGDAEEGCITMPIKLGLKKTVYFVLILGAATGIPLIPVSFTLITSTWYLLGIYILIALIIPLVMAMIHLQKKTTRKHYGKSSLYIKLIMILGIITILIYYKFQYG